jgi:hypothetical protein
MDEDTIANWTKWRFVEVERSLEKIPLTNPWIKSGLMEKIEGEFDLLWQKKVPEVQWKGGVGAGKICQEVVLECANSAFSHVLAMHVHW